MVLLVIAAPGGVCGGHVYGRVWIDADITPASGTAVELNGRIGVGFETEGSHWLVLRSVRWGPVLQYLKPIHSIISSLLAEAKPFTASSPSNWYQGPGANDPARHPPPPN